MDRGNGRENAEQPADGEVISTQNQRIATFRFLTSTGVVAVVDPEGFIEDVINSVNDVTMDGFNHFEEVAAQVLNLEREEDRRALKLGVDSIYHNVQVNIDESFTRWEGICRDRYFNNFPVEPQTISSSSFEITDDVHKNCSDSSSGVEEDVQEQAVDAELSSICSQLIAARREGAKMRRELTSLEKQFTLRKEVLSGMKSVEETFDGALLEEVIKSASLLKDTILKASSVQARNFEGKNFDLSIPLDGRDAAIDKLLG